MRYDVISWFFCFLTLFKRNILGSIHIRNNYNKVCFIGICEPFSDVIELFSRVQNFSSIYNLFTQLFSPIFGLFLFYFFYFLIPYSRSLSLFRHIYNSAGVIFCYVRAWIHHFIFHIVHACYRK